MNLNNPDIAGSYSCHGKAAVLAGTRVFGSRNRKTGSKLSTGREPAPDSGLESQHIRAWVFHFLLGSINAITDRLKETESWRVKNNNNK